MYGDMMRMEPLSDEEIEKKLNKKTQSALGDMIIFLQENIKFIGKRGIDQEIGNNILSICNYITEVVEQKNTIGLEYTELVLSPEEKDETMMIIEPSKYDEDELKVNQLTQKSLGDMCIFLKENVRLIGERGINQEIEGNILSICNYLTQAVEQKNTIGMEYTELVFLPNKQDEDTDEGKKHK